MNTPQTQPRVVVIGAGIGGTSLTALLATAGIPVTLLEKNRYLGGACAGYEKNGFQIDFSTHMFTRGARGPLGEVLRRAGHPDAIEFRRTHDIAEIRYPARDASGQVQSVPIPSQAHRFPEFAWKAARAANLGPLDTVAAARMFADMMRMGEVEVDSWNDRTAEEYITQFTENPRLQALLMFLLGLYFVVEPWKASAGESIYAFQRMARDNWLSYPKGGTKAIPLTYCRIAEQAGADIRTNAGVQRILIEDGKVRGVQLTDGTSIDADIVVSTSSLRTTALHLCEPGVFPDSYVEAAETNVGSYIAVQLKIALKRRLVDAGCLMGAVGATSDLLSVDADGMRQLFAEADDGRVPDLVSFYCPIPTNFDATLAPEGHQLLTVCSLAPTTDVALKDAAPLWEEALLNTMRRIIPGLDEEILFIDRTTTSWMEHWLGKEYGPAISTAQIPGQVGDKRPSITTPVKGLYLAGDGAGGRGVGTELAADSAMECAELIVKTLGRTAPVTWNSDRHASPSLRHVIGQALRPTPVMHAGRW
ncbi:phytoene desaturase family protein [Smaragdicoccus niigatensis]|uniref:phytoene desaturase family protein n=1 Tax=Smaragdicoccus niigatensis TaxID=359359 RepID=UPI00036C99F0|nr:FAD-dependent oxidoreductase [Smaragdicoccus niigatensis]